MPEVQRYSTSFAGKGSRLADIKAILHALDAGQSVEQARHAVIEEDGLDAGTRSSRETVWREFYRRYVSGRSDAHIAALARMVTHCTTPLVQNLILLYEYCQADALLYDLTADCTYTLYQEARTSIGKMEIDSWLTRQETTHPELTQWSPQVRGRLVRGYLATIRDFGLVAGAKQKEFYKLYVPREAFVYALYHQKERGIEGKALVESRDWRLFLLSQPEVHFMLEDATSGGFVHFRYAGDIYDLRPIYTDLREVVHVLTGG